MPTEQVSAREWPARPDLTTPAAVGRATKCDNCNGGCGPQPSGLRDGASTRCTTTSGRGDVLREAWKRVRRNRGAAGVDGQSIRDVEQYGSRALPGRARRRAASRRVPAERGPTPVHTEGRWKEAAAGHPDGAGPGGADGGEAGAGADLRGGLSAVLVRLPAEAERDDGAGGAEEARRQGRPSRARRRHPRLLRKHRPREADEARGATRLGSAGARSCCGSGSRQE